MLEGASKALRLLIIETADYLGCWLLQGWLLGGFLSLWRHSHYREWGLMAQDPLWSLIDLATSSLCICNSALCSPVCSCNVNDCLRTAIRLQSRDWRPFLHEKFGCWLSCSAPPKVYRLLLALSQCLLRSGSFQGGATVCIQGGSLLHDIIVSGIGLLAKIILTHHAQLFLHLAVQIFLLAYLATCRFSCCDHSF